MSPQNFGAGFVAGLASDDAAMATRFKSSSPGKGGRVADSQIEGVGVDPALRANHAQADGRAAARFRIRSMLVDAG
jgi:hypothetical protein